jgi:hypothetical protein
VAAPDLEEPLAIRLVYGDVAPGHDWGSLTGELRLQSSVDVADALEILPGSAAIAALSYRRLIEPLHLTLKLAAEARRWQAGRPSEAGLVHAYFMHPGARWARLFGGVEGATQPLGPDRAFGVGGFLVFEPIATLRSGLHLVSKLGGRVRLQSLARLPADALVGADPDVYNRYTASHPRALFWEEGLELAPLADFLLYGGARLTSNPVLWPNPLDHLSAPLVARAALGHLTVEASVRASWFFAAPERARPFLSRTGALTLLHTLWIGQTQTLLFGAAVAHHLDLRATEIAVRLGWELSNGRRLRDHTPVEGENYFYPQRGPGRETGRLLVEDWPSSPPRI